MSIEGWGLPSPGEAGPPLLWAVRRTGAGAARGTVQGRDPGGGSGPGRQVWPREAVTPSGAHGAPVL